MRRTFALLAIFAVFSQVADSQALSVPEAARVGYEVMNATVLRAHEAVLASDSMEGRETTFPGQKKAAAYIASEFRRIGLKPLATDGSYFQHFDVNVTRLDPATSLTVALAAKTQEHKWGDQFATESPRDTTISGPVAFIGHTDSELSDADQASLAGRVVFVFIGKRDQASDTAKSQVLRRIFASRREPGALALLMITDDGGPASFEKVLGMISEFPPIRGSMRLTPEGTVRNRSGSPFRAFVSPHLAAEILQPSGRTLAALRTAARNDAGMKPILIDNMTVTLRSHILRETKQSENVVGLLEGSDPVLKDQVVAFTGHYDHLGKTADGVVYYGADDDGSGTSTVLNLAEAFAKNPVRTKRSLLFMTVAGEEKGLLGSEYYTSHPLVPLERTMSDLNIDMIGRVDTSHSAPGQERYVYVIGSDKISTELDSVLVASNNATERFNLDYTYDNENDPNQFYRRSDHYNFAKNGVPIVFFFTGVHADYHQPTDTRDKILYDRMASIGRIIYTTGWNLANMPRLLAHRPDQPQAK